VRCLASHTNGQYFASGSLDELVITWSSETFEVLHRTRFPNPVESLVFGPSDVLYAGVYDKGVISCHALEGRLGYANIRASGHITGLAFGIPAYSCVITLPSHSSTYCSHTVLSCETWTPATHVLCLQSTKHRIHIAVAVLYKVRAQGQLMQLPYELVEIILRLV
jgi:WD40 repeat protein